MKLKSLAHALAITGLLTPVTVFATNGMNMDGYGPVAAGMGGASFAYDNGTAAMMNNPATMALMKEGKRADLALGFLGPDVKTSANGASATSSADAFYMPAFGWISKTRKLLYGFGVYGQGGMGTEYANGALWGRMFATDGTTSVADPLLQNRSEVGFGRAIFPLAYQVDDSLSIGGSLDFAWAGMDIRWLIDGAHFGDMMGGTQRFGTISGTMPAAMGVMGVTQTNWGYFDFSNTNDFKGEARGYGFAGKIGIVYKVSPQLTIGATYHGKTRISDLETGNNAKVTFSTNIGTMSLTGKVKVIDFQWPETFGFGLAYQANDKLILVGDYKRINWSDSMKSFKMSVTASSDASNPAPFQNTYMDMNYFQNWNNQNVYMLGLSYKYSDNLTLRVGLNMANNPVPNEFMSPLFPAIIKNHASLGFGYAFDKASSIDFSYTYAQNSSATNSWSAVAGDNQTVNHSQDSWQFIYSYRY